MPCPCFEPVEALPWPRWPGAVKPPLGKLFAGRCRSGCGAQSETPAELDLELCNLGYAAGRCSRFPGGPDALQLSARAAPDGGWTILFVLEQAYLPVASGVVAVAPDGRLELPPAAAPYEALIGAYAACCRESTV